jgi:hypothetical protein
MENIEVSTHNEIHLHIQSMTTKQILVKIRTDFGSSIQRYQMIRDIVIDLLRNQLWMNGDFLSSRYIALLCDSRPIILQSIDWITWSSAMQSWIIDVDWNSSKEAILVSRIIGEGCTASDIIH